MKREEILPLVAGVPTGTTLELTFAEINPLGVIHLLRESNAGHVVLSDRDYIYVMCVVQSGEWGSPEDRMLAVTTASSFDASLLAHRLDEMIESLVAKEPTTNDYFVYIDIDSGKAKSMKDCGRDTRIIEQGFDQNKHYVGRFPNKSTAKVKVDQVNDSLLWIVGMRDGEFIILPQYDGSGDPPFDYEQVEIHGSYTSAQRSI